MSREGSRDSCDPMAAASQTALSLQGLRPPLQILAASLSLEGEGHLRSPAPHNLLSDPLWPVQRDQLLGISGLAGKLICSPLFGKRN